MSCSHPKIINNRIVPCGSCVFCRKKRQNDWAVRLDIERKLNQDKSLFITLTYSDEYLPEDGLLNKRDYQLFMKRLRKAVAPIKLRYFLSGEYGEKYGRPHYHLILFGLELNQENIKLINDKWNMGFTKILPVTWKNCRYVAKYSVKQFQKQKQGGFKVDGVTGEVNQVLISEFVSMSRRCGLGYGIFDNKEVLQTYFKDNSVKCGNYYYSLPKSFVLKAKQLNLDIFPDKKLNIIYNDKIFKDKQYFMDSVQFENLLYSCKVEYSIKDFFEVVLKDGDYFSSKFNIISFKDYLKDLLDVNLREINFCKIRKIDYFQFYFRKIKRFLPFIFSGKDEDVRDKSESVVNWLNDFFSSNDFDFSNFTAYKKFIENFLYSNFDLLYY